MYYFSFKEFLSFCQNIENNSYTITKIQFNKYLTTNGKSNQMIQEEGFRYLCDSLSKNTFVTELDVSGTF